MRKISRLGAFALLCSFAIIFTGCGYLTPEKAAERTSIGLSTQPYFEGDGCRFYYNTVGVVYDQAGEAYADWLCEVMPVVQNDHGMWHTITNNPHDHVVYPHGIGESVGTLSFVESNGIYYNFFIPGFRREDMATGQGLMILPEGLPTEYNRITVNGVDYTPEQHSYFITDFEVEEFEINGQRYIVENGQNAGLIQQWQEEASS